MSSLHIFAEQFVGFLLYFNPNHLGFLVIFVEYRADNFVICICFQFFWIMIVFIFMFIYLSVLGSLHREQSRKIVLNDNHIPFIECLSDVRKFITSGCSPFFQCRNHNPHPRPLSPSPVSQPQPAPFPSIDSSLSRCLERLAQLPSTTRALSLLLNKAGSF